MKNKKGSILLLLGLIYGTTYCQSTTLSSGGLAYGSNGSVSYSIGQIIHESQFGKDGKVSQGIQQPFEISQVLGNHPTPGINLLMSVFPNPATEILSLQVEEYFLEELSYSFFDSNGRILDEKKILNRQTSINLTGLPSSIYFLKVKIKNKEIKNFKIIKK